MKKGIILEGGAMRGMFTAGVLDVFMENNVEFDGMIGVSAGAAFGCNYKSRQIGRALRYNTEYCKDPRYCGIRSLIKTGDIFGAEFCYHTLPDELDIFDFETFEQNPMEFYTVSTDLNTGEPIYHRCDKADYDCLEWIRASASMPFVSNPVEVGGYTMLDGGMSDSVPVKYFESIGYDRNIVVLTQPKGYVKKQNRAIPLLKLTMRKYPRAVETFAMRHEVYNETMAYINEKEEKGEIFVIRPEATLEIGRIEHDPDNLRRIYNVGREVGEKQLKGALEFLGCKEGSVK